MDEQINTLIIRKQIQEQSLQQKLDLARAETDKAVRITDLDVKKLEDEYIRKKEEAQLKMMAQHMNENSMQLNVLDTV